jgi:hypothetical protein
VYVDNDPLVLTHARALLAGAPEGACAYIDADVRDVDTILEQAARTLDFSRPIGLTMLGIMGQLPDEDGPWAIVDRLVAALPPGSYLALSDGTNTSETLNTAIRTYNANSAGSYHLRSPEQIAGFFHGLDLVDPGVVRTAAWRPDPGRPRDNAAQGHAASGVGRKP